MPSLSHASPGTAQCRPFAVTSMPFHFIPISMNSPSFIERIKLFLNGARLNAQPFARVSGNGPVSALCSDVDALPLHSDLNEFAQLYRAHQAFPERCPS